MANSAGKVVDLPQSVFVNSLTDRASRLIWPCETETHALSITLLQSLSVSHTQKWMTLCFDGGWSARIDLLLKWSATCHHFDVKAQQLVCVFLHILSMPQKMPHTDTNVQSHMHQSYLKKTSKSQRKYFSHHWLLHQLLKRQLSVILKWIFLIVLFHFYTKSYNIHLLFSI